MARQVRPTHSVGISVTGKHIEEYAHQRDNMNSPMDGQGLRCALELAADEQYRFFRVTVNPLNGAYEHTPVRIHIGSYDSSFYTDDDSSLLIEYGADHPKTLRDWIHIVDQYARQYTPWRGINDMWLKAGNQYPAPMPATFIVELPEDIHIEERRAEASNNQTDSSDGN